MYKFNNDLTRKSFLKKIFFSVDMQFTANKNFHPIDIRGKDFFVSMNIILLHNGGNFNKNKFVSRKEKY